MTQGVALIGLWVWGGALGHCGRMCLHVVVACSTVTDCCQQTDEGGGRGDRGWNDVAHGWCGLL